MRGELKSVFKLVLIKEPLPWRLIYKTNEEEKKPAVVKIPYHISHLTILELDQVISD